MSDVTPPLEFGDRNTPELLLKRALMWLGLLADAADVEPEETMIRIGIGPHGRTVAQVTLADDMRAIEAICGPPAIRPSDLTDG